MSRKMLHASCAAAIWREESDRAKRRGAKINEAGERIYRVGEPIDAEDARAHGWPGVGPCIAAIALAIAALPRGAASRRHRRAVAGRA
jgi:hypothetical protein